MQPLGTEFEDRTFHYTQLERQEDLAIFAQTHKTGQITRYEVVRVKMAPEHTWPSGDVSPECEVYPGSSAWGRDGWTFYTLAEAQQWVQKLQAKAVV